MLGRGHYVRGRSRRILLITWKNNLLAAYTGLRKPKNVRLQNPAISDLSPGGQDRSGECVLRLPSTHRDSLFARR